MCFLEGGITGDEAYDLVLNQTLASLRASKKAEDEREARKEAALEKVKKARVDAAPLLERFKAFNAAPPGTPATTATGEKVKKLTGAELRTILIAYGIAIPTGSKVDDLWQVVLDNWPAAAPP